MEKPLRVTTDREGNFQEINGRPMMIVFNSGPREVRARRTSPKTAAGSQKPGGEQNQVPRSLEFVNVSGAASINDSSRKLIRRHVMNDYRRRERDRDQVQTDENNNVTPLPSAPLGVAGPFHVSETVWSSRVPGVEWQRFGSLDPFAQFPVTMKPHMYDLASQYLTLVGPATCPKEPYSEPDHTEADWFDLAMRDAALFHVIIGGSAMYFDLLGGAKRSRERDLHIMEVVHLLVDRIKAAGSGISDSTIATVAFLAKIQCIMGNYEQWSMHIDGLQRMIEMRGGQNGLNVYLQWKVHRADMMGCAEFGSKPRFPSVDGSLGPNQPVVILPRPSRISNLETFAITEQLSPDLIYAIKSIQHLTDSINFAHFHDEPRDARSTEKVVALIRRLVMTASPRLDDTEAVMALEHAASHDKTLQEPLRLGALIYLKTLILQPPFPRLPSTTLINRFQTALNEVIPEQQSSSILLWLAFTGGMFLTSRETERSWFVEYAATLSHFLGVVDWDGAKAVLMGFWWVGSVHEEEARRFWVEIMAAIIED